MSGARKPILWAKSAPASAHQRGRVGEGHRLVAREVDAHRLRRDLAVADRDQGAAGRRAQQVAR